MSINLCLISKQNCFSSSLVWIHTNLKSGVYKVKKNDKKMHFLLNFATVPRIITRIEVCLVSSTFICNFPLPCSLSIHIHSYSFYMSNFHHFPLPSVFMIILHFLATFDFLNVVVDVFQEDSLEVTDLKIKWRIFLLLLLLLFCFSWKWFFGLG